MKTSFYGWKTAVASLFFLTVVGYGWVMNIVKLLGVDGGLASWGGVEIVRIAGIFLAPVGAIAGYF